MNGKIRHPDVRQNLGHAVLSTWREQPEMVDPDALRAYEAALAHCRAEARGKPPPTPNLRAPDAAAYRALLEVCEWQLGPRTPSGLTPDEPPAPVSVTDLQACLQRLCKSVESWDRRGGRRGDQKLVSQSVL